MEEADLITVLLYLIERDESPEVKQLCKLLLQRIERQTEVITPSRMPVPLNITEMGGYYNLLKKHDEAMALRLLASTLGLPK